MSKGVKSNSVGGRKEGRAEESSHAVVSCACVWMDGWMNVSEREGNSVGVSIGGEETDQ